MEKERTIKDYNFKPLFFVIFFAVAGVFFSADPARAASLYFSPASVSVLAGHSFSVNVGVTSADKAMNAASGTVSFPSDMVEVTSITKTDSIISLWVQEPSFSSNSVNFEGIVLNPGYTGSAGRIITINFRAKAAGVATLNFSAGSVLANDGLGTSILSGMGNATITITESGATPPPPTPTPTNNLPAAPAVTSSSHPDQNVWYANNNVDLSWALPSGTTAVSYAIDGQPNSTPPPKSNGLVSNYTAKNVADGAGYFHVRLKNSAGWGPAGNFKFQVDITPPDPFTVTMVDGAETGNPQPTATWNATDATSGIDHYEVKIDDADAFTVAPSEMATGNNYTLPEQQSGSHHLTVTAVDKAGNRTSASTDFTVVGLIAPKITKYDERLVVGDNIVIEGTSDYPQTPLVMFVEENGGSPQSTTVRTDDQGNFYYINASRADLGVYKVWAQIANDKGIKSPESDHITIAVGSRISFKDYWVYLLIILILLLIIIHSYVFWRHHRKIVRIKREFKNDSEELEETLHQEFTSLRDRLYDQVGYPNNANGSRRLDVKDLEEAEKVIQDKLNKIKRDRTDI
jgi:hypothetical protein